MEKVIIGICVIVALVIIVVLIILKTKKNFEIVKKHSDLYKNIIFVNNKYKFDNSVKDKIQFNPIMKSKKGLDNLNLAEYVTSEIKNNKPYYEALLKSIKSNGNKYNNYLIEYKSIEKYMTQEDFKKIQATEKIKHKTFINCEKKLYKSSRLEKPITNLVANFHATYTSPSGKNHYWKDGSFEFSDLMYFLNSINEYEESLLAQKREKERISEEKRAKEKKLRELEKKEKELKERESTLEKDTAEFLDATKGNIYSSEEKLEESSKIVIDENEKPYQKIKKLKLMLDNGEISIDEYMKKRNEIL